MRFATLFAISLSCALGITQRASAGPVESMIQVALSPTDPNVMIVRYTWGGDGMLRSDDGGKSWKLVCDSLLFETSSTHSGPVVIAGDGTTFMGVFSGLWQDDKHACGWKSVSQYDGQWMGDLALHPTDPNVMFAVTSTASTMTEKKVNGVLMRDASGTWTDIGTKAEMLATRVHVATVNGKLRFYVGAISGQVTPPDGGALSPNYVTRVSDDMGMTWKENVYGTVDGTLRIQGVDPTNPDRIIASINRSNDDMTNTNDTLLVSSDQGAHFTEYLTIAEIGGVVFASDGQVWIGDSGNSMPPPNNMPGGLWHAKSLDEKPQQLPMGTFPVQCLAYQGSTKSLYACQRYWFGKVNLDDGSFSSIIKFTDVPQMVACDGVDVAGICKQQLCNAYCGFSHFAVAPMCSVYDDPTCGKTVQAIEAADNGSGGAAAGAGAAGVGGTGVSATAGMSASAAGSVAISGSGGGAAIDAGTAIDAGQPQKKKSGGCSALDVASSTPGLLAYLSAFPILAWRRTRKPRAR